MNDFDYEVQTKKKLARNAKYRKSTLGRKGCTLPHEYLTKKELTNMNGELYSVNLNEPISWERFKTLTPSLQEEYLQHLMDCFGIGLSAIGKDMFGMAAASLNNYVNRHKMKLSVRTGGRTPKAAYESWRRWLDKATQAEEPDPEPTIAPVIEEPEEPDEDVKLFRTHDYEKPTPPTFAVNTTDDNLYPLTDMTLTLKGTPIDVLNTFRMSFPALLDKDKEYRFCLTVNVCYNERRPEHL